MKKHKPDGDEIDDEELLERLTELYEKQKEDFYELIKTGENTIYLEQLIKKTYLGPEQRKINENNTNEMIS